MEITARDWKAFSALKEQCEVVIFTDSQYVERCNQQGLDLWLAS